MRLNKESYDMPHDTFLKGNNHLLNNIFGSTHAYIELLYHLTHIFYVTYKHAIPKNVYQLLY